MMSLQAQNAWKSYYGGVDRCWVPNCPNSRNSGYTKQFFRLPSNPKYKEIWIALAGKKLAGSQFFEIYYCQDHFKAPDMDVGVDKSISLKRNAVPYANMPQRFCQTCMRLIENGGLFCVLSKTIPSLMPPDIKPDLLHCRPEPLYQILTFCIPDLNLQHDPPPLVCYNCFQTIWVYFRYKLTCNAVEKGLRGNLTASEYGKMVLCRTCPQTSGSSFFILAEDTLMGILLKKMFLNDYPSDVVPLKVCLKCWNTLYKLKNFYEQCVATDEKMQRHISMTETGLPISQFSPENPPQLDKSKETLKQLRQIRKPINQNGGATATVTNPSAERQASNNDLAPHASVIKFSNNFETSYNVPKKIEMQMQTPEFTVCEVQASAEPTTSTKPDYLQHRGYQDQYNACCAPLRPDGHPPAVQQEATNTWSPPVVNSKPSDGSENAGAWPRQEQHGYHKRGYTWLPPHQNAKPDPVHERAKMWVPPAVSAIEENVNAPVAKASITKLEGPVSDRVTRSASFVGSSPDKVNSSGKTGSEHKPVHNQVDTGLERGNKLRYTDEQKIALARLMLQYGEPLKYQITPDVEFKVWASVVTEFHKFYNSRSFDSIQRTWKLMMHRADETFQQIGPANYLDQLVINYKYSYPADLGEESAGNVSGGRSVVNVSGEDCDIIILDGDDEMLGNGADDHKGKIASEPSSKIPALRDCINPSSNVPMKPKRGRPTKVINNVVLLQVNVKKKPIGRPKAAQSIKWTFDDKLELARAIRKEYERCLRNNELITGKSPWKMILERLIVKKYQDCNFEKLYALWTKMKQSATIYEKNGQDLIDEEVWETLQIQSAVQKSVTKSPAKDPPTPLAQNNEPQNIPTSETMEIESTPSPPSSEPSVADTGSISEAKDTDNFQDSVTTSPASTSKSSPKKRKLHNRSDDDSDDRSKQPSEPMPQLNAKSSSPQKIMPHQWTDSEKMEFFKLVKVEFNSMVKNNEPLARPWRKVVQRLAQRGHKNCDEDSLYKLWTNIRNVASLHENDRQMTILDCKVIRLLRRAKEIRKAMDTTKTKDDQKLAQPDAGTSKDVEVSANSETSPSRNKPKKNSSKSPVVDVTETVEESVEVADSSNSWKGWPLSAKLDLISVIKSYGSDVFKNKKSRRKNFWREVMADYKAKGYDKDLKEIYGYWHNMHRSAKMAWAQQKKASPLDTVIIEFMMEMIEKKDKDKEESVDNVAEEEGNSFDDEISDAISDFTNNLETEEEKAPTVIEENGNDEDKLDAETVDDDNENNELNYNYVSLEDIENNYGSSIGKNEVTEAVVKTEVTYVSLADCGITLPLETQTAEIIVIDDSDEE